MTTFSSEKIISTNADRAYSVYAADVDGDGDLDVLSASAFDNKIAWYENDSSGNFTERIISTTAERSRSVYAADVDGDGDIDVLSVSNINRSFPPNGDDTITWYENDGNESFSERTVSTMAYNAFSVSAVDMDGDGDLDVLAANGSSSIAWYENDGSENFSQRPIPNTLSFSIASFERAIYPADVDSDGDMDVLAIALDSNETAWYENDGSENFTQRIISTSGSGYSIYAADVDGDDDLDVLSASFGQIAWYENDGSETFTQRTISTNVNRGRSVYAADMDGDGDLDVLSASFEDDTIAWYENDGSGNFTQQTISTNANGAKSVYAADVDGDGDLDVLSASANDDKIAWYENKNEQFGDGATNVLFGSNFGDAIFGEGGIDYLYGGNGDDCLHGGDDTDSLLGQAGDDNLFGDAGVDYLFGDVGVDTLDGGTGDDFLYGDAFFLEIERFVLRSGDGNDTIYYYNDNQDKFLLDGLTFGMGAGEVQAVPTFFDLNTELRIGGADGELLATLVGVNSAFIEASDFITA